jgi:hypothetical protein
MIRYSHVSLLIPCDSDGAATITTALGVAPTRVREDISQIRRPDGGWQNSAHRTWMFDSPKSHADGDPTTRLSALADAIEPFAGRLLMIRPQFKPFVDILYHVTPQHPHGVTGEFDWFRMPAELMRRYGVWDLNVSFEAMWFDHPEWIRPKQKDWLSRIRESLWNRKTKLANPPTKIEL